LGYCAVEAEHFWPASPKRRKNATTRTAGLLGSFNSGRPLGVAEAGRLGVRLPERSSHTFLLIKVLPNDTIKSHTIIATNAAPHLYLSRSFAPGISLVTDAWAAGVLGTLRSATPGDGSFRGTGFSFFTEDRAFDALGNSSAFLDGASGFETSIGGGSWDSAASFGFNRLNSKLLV
jgi:hypothetical protein